VTTVLLVRHGLTATTGQVLTGWTPGVGLDDRGRAQARALGARIAPVVLDAVVTSPLDRCGQTVAELIAARNGHPGPAAPVVDDRVGECRYGDWTGKPLAELAKDPLWPVVQAHPSAVRFPGAEGESMLDMQHRAVSAIREWNERLGRDATYLVCSHGDVIKAIVADSLGLHLDQCQRIIADPCSLTVINYTPMRPFLLQRCRDRRRRGHRCGRRNCACGKRRRGGWACGKRRGCAGCWACGKRRGCGGFWAFEKQGRRGRRAYGRRRCGRIGLMPVFYYDPPDRFVAGSVGQPGDRTFYLQATSAGRVTSVALEKFQVSLLAERLDELLDEVLRRTGAAEEIPETAPPSLRDDGPLDLPLTEDFRVGAIALAWDSDGDRVVIEAQEDSDAPIEPLSEDIPVDGPGVLRVRITPSAARAFAHRALNLGAAGRPPCPLCGLPLDASGHVCPRQNGHRASRA
jgi:probable phosphomutase (TIGR03848 family)/uncharacterized repeat protein (TIGR03847 family)